jgi:threonine dehydrogenase-like Zn-dependent dehydrogenase
MSTPYSTVAGSEHPGRSQSLIVRQATRSEVRSTVTVLAAPLRCGMVRAVRSTPTGIEIVDGPEPDAASGVRVRIRAAGICGSDLHMVARTQAKGLGIGVTLGHELSGVLDDGTPVGIEPLTPCESCDQCLAGDYHRCRSGVILIGAGSDGGMADEVRVPLRTLVPLPEALAVGDACLIEPAAVAVHGLRLAGAASGTRVGVVGGGTIGLFAAAAAKALGCTVGIGAGSASGMETRHASPRREPPCWFSGCTSPPCRCPA